MLRTYLNVAFRSLAKNKFFSILNITGLAVGMACVLLIYLYISDEMSFDKHVPHHDRVYRVHVKGRFGGSDMNIAVSNASFAPTIVNDYPEIESFFRFRSKGAQIIKYGEHSLKENEAIFADSNYFEFWGAKLIQGDPQTALKNPQSMVITKALAEKIFGNEDPMDKYVKIAGLYEYKITGIMEEMPENTHFTFQVLMSMTSLEEAKDPLWLNMNFVTYIRLMPGTRFGDLEAKFPEMVVKYIGPEIQHFMGISIEEFEKSGNKVGYYLAPLADLHLRNTAESTEYSKDGDIKYIYIFGIIGAFILVIACINFMNLATAKSANRAREVGIRKVIGAQRKQLIGQFISESMLISLLSLLTALIMVVFSFPVFNRIAGKNLSPEILTEPHLIALMLGIVIIVGLLAGSYPAFFLSAFQPVKVLKGRLAQGAKGGKLRSSLVVFQFVISIFLIIGTLTVYQQLQFIQNKKLGFDKDQILILENAYMLRNSMEAFRNEVIKNAEFKDGSISSFTPTPSTSDWVSAFWLGKNPDNKNTSTCNLFSVDEHYVPTYGLTIKEGRNFSKDFATDTAAILVNETLVRHFGIQEPLGQIISSIHNIDENGNTSYIHYKVIGVVEDFHFQNLKAKIRPVVIRNGATDARISFRVNTSDYAEAISTLKSKWDEFAPGQPFEYKFADQELMTQYEQEQKINQLFGIFTGFAILIACLGLFGLASYTTEQRTKEIGIRKVLGASVQKIIILLSREFLILVVISFAISAPLAWYFMSSWLQDFEYRTELSVWIFLASGLGAFLIAWLTMSYQSIRSAVENPVKSLRTE